MHDIVCFICAKRIPAAFKNAHHAKPQAAGGGPDDLVDLCAGDHANLHRLQNMLAGPRASQAEDTCRAFYADNPGAGKRCMELAIKCVQHMSAAKAGQYQVKPHEDVELIVEIPLAIKQALTVLGREARDPQTGRRLGIAGAARRILVDAMSRRFPELAKQAQLSMLEQTRQNPDRMYARPKRRTRQNVETT